MPRQPRATRSRSRIESSAPVASAAALHCALARQGTIVVALGAAQGILEYEVEFLGGGLEIWGWAIKDTTCGREILNLGALK